MTDVPTPLTPHRWCRTATYSFAAPLEIVPENRSLVQPRAAEGACPGKGGQTGSKTRSTARVTRCAAAPVAVAATIAKKIAPPAAIRRSGTRPFVNRGTPLPLGLTSVALSGSLCRESNAFSAAGSNRVSSRPERNPGR
jgi:hypothetical protein